MNQILFELKKDKEKEFSIEECKKAISRSTVHLSEIDTKVYDKYDTVGLDVLIHTLTEAKNKGANSVELCFDDENNEIHFNFVNAGLENEDSYLKKVMNYRNSKIESAVREKQQQLQDHNRDVAEYLKLKAKFES